MDKSKVARFYGPQCKLQTRHHYYFYPPVVKIQELKTKLN